MQRLRPTSSHACFAPALLAALLLALPALMPAAARAQGPAMDANNTSPAGMSVSGGGGYGPAPMQATPSSMPANTNSSNPMPRQPSSIALPGGSNYIPPPPPATALPNGASVSTNASDLAAQAEAAALQAQADADAAQARREQEHNAKSFNRAESGILPLSPDQIRDFMHKLEQTQDAAEPPFAGAPKGEVRIATLSLDPGAEPPQINLDPGYVTTINMVDATGAPWPILDVGVGGNFEVSPTPAGTHVVRIMPLTRVGMGNLSVLLKDLPTPVIFRLNSGGPTIDMRYDARIPKFGPNGKQPLVAHEHLVAGDETLMMMLENVPPKAAARMKVGGLDSRTMAWSLGDKTYVRTPLQMLSPAWNASVSSADGMTVYEIGDAPVLLMSDNGAMVRARLSKDETQ